MGNRHLTLASFQRCAKSRLSPLQKSVLPPGCGMGSCLPLLQVYFFFSQWQKGTKESQGQKERKKVSLTLWKRWFKQETRREPHTASRTAYFTLAKGSAMQSTAQTRGGGPGSPFAQVVMLWAPSWSQQSVSLSEMLHSFAGVDGGCCSN